MNNDEKFETVCSVAELSIKALVGVEKENRRYRGELIEAYELLSECEEGSRKLSREVTLLAEDGDEVEPSTLLEWARIVGQFEEKNKSLKKLLTSAVAQLHIWVDGSVLLPDGEKNIKELIVKCQSAIKE